MLWKYKASSLFLLLSPLHMKQITQAISAYQKITAHRFLELKIDYHIYKLTITCSEYFYIWKALTSASLFLFASYLMISIIFWVSLITNFLGQDALILELLTFELGNYFVRVGELSCELLDVTSFYSLGFIIFKK